MTASASNTPINSPRYRQVSMGHNADVLTQIYDDAINLAIWQRQLGPAVRAASNELLNATKVQCRATLSSGKIAAYLSASLPTTPHRQALIDDICLVAEMFSYLFGLDQIGLRLSSLEVAMCPKFHVDRVPCRLVTSYAGTGTEWVGDQGLDRSKLGRGSQGLSDAQSGLLSSASTIETMGLGHVGLLKGELWQGNENYGLVHRSPTPDAADKRLLLSLDFA
ncbi:MAG: DUF1826 domain-containing protein [Cellvibrionaceae bacterium]|nr:DUF1826 domain-containing protein [Cellvibrionaceae bacterium]